ncbi:ribonuclease HI [Pelobacter seleniigenes]|uniref:ribonuclease HI n=1 Tax=Pelobacter seleniigenes TaxID=407188 RepID=UPI0004A75397|nr:RNase H family protein [Pelobacter seleniigenes]
MSALHLFIDGSVDPRSKIGFGACLLLTSLPLTSAGLQDRVRTRRFSETSSTRLELQTLLWALQELPVTTCPLFIHTDSRNVAGLLAREDRLRKRDFCARSGRPLNNAQLYRELYPLISARDCTFIKQPGHPPAAQRNLLDQLFSLVDRAARLALRRAD